MCSSFMGGASGPPSSGPEVSHRALCDAASAVETDATAETCEHAADDAPPRRTQMTSSSS